MARFTSFSDAKLISLSEGRQESPGGRSFVAVFRVRRERIQLIMFMDNDITGYVKVPNCLNGPLAFSRYHAKLSRRSGLRSGLVSWHFAKNHFKISKIQKKRHHGSVNRLFSAFHTVSEEHA